MLAIITAILIQISVVTTDGKPIKGAGVFCDMELNITDSAGHIVFSVEPGPHWIKVHKDGFKGFEGEIRFTAEEPNETIIMRER